MTDEDVAKARAEKEEEDWIAKHPLTRNSAALERISTALEAIERTLAKLLVHLLARLP